MKVCPTCGRVTNDEAQMFCLMDGAELIAGDTQPTVAILTESSVPTAVIERPRQKRSPLVWVGIALLVLLVIGGVVAGLMYFAYKLGSESSRTNVAANSSPTPR